MKIIEWIQYKIWLTELSFFINMHSKEK
jgi:hypothetical protein